MLFTNKQTNAYENITPTHAAKLIIMLIDLATGIWKERDAEEHDTEQIT